MANPLYGQNKFDDKLDVKGRLVQNGGIPVQDSTGVAPVGGLVIPPYPVYRGAVAASSGGFDFADADPYTESASQLFPLGSSLNWGDRAFKYAQVDGAITAGLCVQQPVLVANHSQMAATDAYAATTTDTTIISIETVGTDLTLNQYQEGFLYVNDGTGQGQSWKVKSHPAHTHSSDPSCEITVYGKVSTALVASATSQLSLMENPFKDVIVAPVAETGAVVGVTNIDMTDDYFGWLQVRGPKAVLAASTLVLGHNAVRNDTTTAGAVMADNGDDLVQEIGTVMASVVVDSEYCMIDLNI
jgi:hypothetical protein